jgi:hypothetical protein
LSASKARRIALARLVARDITGSANKQKMSRSLRAFFLCLSLALARADFVLNSLFADPNCAGDSVPLTVDAGACNPVDDNFWQKLVCNSSSSINFNTYDNAQCAGTPISSFPNPSNAYSCTYSSELAGFMKAMCVSAPFDPEQPQPYLSQDLYIVNRGSAGGATCPPTLGSGVQLYVRQYFSNIKEQFTLGECNVFNNGKSSAYIDCDPRDQRTLLLEQFDNSPDCTGDANSVYDGCQNASGKKTMKFLPSMLSSSNVGVGAPVQYDQIVFMNAGTLCLTPQPTPQPPPRAAASLSTAGIVGIGAVVGLASATLALVANYAYQRSLLQRSRPVDTAPLLHAGVGMVAR